VVQFFSGFHLFLRVELFGRAVSLHCQFGAAQTALHRAFQRGGVVAGSVVARQQQAGQGGLL